MIDVNELLTVSDVAKEIKVTPQYVRKLISEEKLKAGRVGKQCIKRAA